MTTTMEKKIQKELQDITYYVSADQVVEEKGLLWRIKPRYAKDKAQTILSLLRKALPKPMDYAENVFDKNTNNLEIALYNQRKDAFNSLLSDITRLLGGEV